MTYKQNHFMTQFKLLHRLLNVNVYLYKCKLEDSELCEVCLDRETISHVFLECADRRKFIADCKKWIDNVTNLSFQITDHEILFGIINHTVDEHIGLLTDICLMLKCIFGNVGTHIKCHCLQNL